ncbi:zinc ribbon domain-containing protein [Vibrio sp.]|uniref:Zinc ribbon domain-containing protein n=1 Tax=Vibrio viridaestus TaxID=2487322 RepID=A0A3N9TKA8_9VIBR|nr:zinc ribbon domain-containing protein [Vibrio viridaestus]MDC0611926.1 zinc ribbon domain-containing protein [Vibrio sp.]RQW64005.1 zinc ribbon domain-containing protein [Vibrio viridaestus]
MSKEKKIYKCKSCKETVEKNAKTCPHCGVKNPTITTAQGCFSFIILSLIIGFGFYACSDNQSTNNTKTQSQMTQLSDFDKSIDNLLHSDAPQPATVFYTDDISFASRSRLQAKIYTTTATTNDQLLATAASAARQLQQKNRVQFVSVIVFTSETDHEQPLTLDYAPDRKGTSGEKDTGSQYEVTWYQKLDK